MTFNVILTVGAIGVCRERESVECHYFEYTIKMPVYLLAATVFSLIIIELADFLRHTHSRTQTSRKTDKHGRCLKRARIAYMKQSILICRTKMLSEPDKLS